MKNIIEAIRNNNSRIKSYILLGEVGSGKTKELLKIENIKYINFLEEAKKFFDKEMLSLTLFEIGIFFKYIERLIDYNRGIVVIDNLEFVQNILYNLEKNENGLKKFFDSMIMQAYTGKVIFIISNIKKMKLENILEKSKLPEENIIIWRKKDAD
ncbi:MAG: hypothetical protein Q7K47_01970 [Fusobacterium sp. JB019]|nr:hypothetical protein [Fusobacterium sp. JB019]